MPRPPAYLLRWSEEQQRYEWLSAGNVQLSFAIASDSAWSDFLKGQNAFSFQGRNGHLSVIKEKRPRGTGYWYAYRSHNRRTRKRYLGQTASVTIALIEEVAGQLSNADEASARQFPNVAAQSPLLLPRFLPPRLSPSLIERQDLLARLDAALERKITFLVAPAGSGKTTLVGQWLRDRRPPSLSLAWLSLDRDDNALYRFWLSLLAACQTLRKDLGQEALSLLTNALHPPYTSISMEAVLTLFLNDLARQLPSGLLILDDYQNIEEPAIHETLTFFLDHLPPTFSVLLLMRGEPVHLPLLRWRAGGDLSELHGTDLRFSREETASFVRKHFPLPLSPTALNQLDASLQGWAAGLRLLSLANPSSQAIEQTLSTLHRSANVSSPYQPVLDYFTSEILNTQPEQLRRFLLQTSVLNHLNASLCQAITSDEQSALLLDMVARSGLFLEVLDGGWYRFHALFAEAMRREAERCLGTDALRLLSRHASAWYEQHNMIDEAIESSLLAHDYERTAFLIEYVSMDGSIDRLSLARRWLSALPDDVLGKRPMLCWLAALASGLLQEDAGPAETNDRSRIASLLQMAKEGWQLQGNLSLIGLIDVFAALKSWRAGQIAQASLAAQQALVHISGTIEDQHLRVWRGICLFISATGLMYEGRFSEARASFLDAYRNNTFEKGNRFTHSVLLLIGVCCSILGEFYQAHEYYQQVLSLVARPEDRDIQAQALLGLATIAFEWNELARAKEQADAALRLAQDEKSDLHVTTILLLAHISFARGEITTAQRHVSTLLARLQVATHEGAQRLSTVLLFSARLALSINDLQAVHQILTSPVLQEEATITDLLRARLSLAEGKPQEAISLLEKLAQTEQGLLISVETRLLLALAYAASQDLQQARPWLQQALVLARSEGLLRIFLSEGEPLARLLRQLTPTFREATPRSYAQTLLRTFALPGGESIPNQPTSAPWPIQPLSSQEHRVLRLLASGRSNLEIAQELVVSVNTVKDHAKHIYRKLGVSNRLQASEIAHRLSLL